MNDNLRSVLFPSNAFLMLTMPGTSRLAFAQPVGIQMLDEHEHKKMIHANANMLQKQCNLH